MNSEKRIVLTGFMGVGKSTVAKCLAYILQCEKIDLDRFIEQNEQRTIVEIIESDGETRFRRNRNRRFAENFDRNPGARYRARRRHVGFRRKTAELIKACGCTTVWLESTFEHCWRNISCSKQARPLAKDKNLAEKLFNERQKIYCLADWHFIVKPQLTSFDIARRIAEEIF